MAKNRLKNYGGLQFALCGLICLLFALSCSQENQDWENAKRENTINAYQVFLDRHPQSPFVPEAKTLISSIAWDGIKTQRSAQAFRDFVAKYPNDTHAKDALSKIDLLETVKETKEMIYQWDSSAQGLITFESGLIGVEFIGEIQIPQNKSIETLQGINLAFIPGVKHKFINSVKIPAPVLRFIVESNVDGSQANVAGSTQLGWVGKVNVKGVAAFGEHEKNVIKLDSDPTDPLLLLVTNAGYKYFSGKGKLALPDGTEYMFP